MAVVFDDHWFFAENVRKCDFHYPRFGVPCVVHEFAECAFAGSVAFPEQGGKSRIDGEAGGRFHGEA
jgi:hypothetical protein